MLQGSVGVGVLSVSGIGIQPRELLGEVLLCTPVGSPPVVVGQFVP